MRPALYDTLTVDVTAGPYLFRALGSQLRSRGSWRSTSKRPTSRRRRWPRRTSSPRCRGCRRSRPGSASVWCASEPKHFTQPPPRYTEASLVKELEEKGIGRPSTYAQILTTIQKREYVQKDRGSLSPTDLGETVNTLLVKAFPDIFEVAFTAQMESLDEIEEGDRKWVETVGSSTSRSRRTSSRPVSRWRTSRPKPTDETCPQCGEGKLGEVGPLRPVLACERYPDCKYTRNPGDSAQAEPEQAGVTCDKCGRPMVYKQSRFGRFIGCSGYPECKNIKKITLGIPCPQGDGELVENRSKRGRAYFGCSNFPDCRFVVWQRPVVMPCPKCGVLLDPARRPGQAMAAVLARGCDYRRETESA